MSVYTSLLQKNVTFAFPEKITYSRNSIISEKMRTLLIRDAYL